MLANLDLVLNRFVSVRSILQICLGVVLLGALSQLSIPLKPVPITLQTMGVMALGLLYSRQAALCSVVTYLTLGACGVPVFANGSAGFHQFAGPTGGYLVGFLAAVAVMTSFRAYARSENIWFTMLNCVLGTVVIFAFGIAWLSMFVGAKQAIVLGLLPFIIPGVVKAVLLSFAVRYVKRS